MNYVDTKTFLTFSVMDCLFWAFFAACAGFTTTYLLECGMSSSVLSIMLAAYMGSSFFGAFFWGPLCDKKQTNRNIFIPEYIAAVATGFLIWFFASRNYWISACLYPIFGFLAVPLGSNLDSWMLRAFHKDAGTYGRARSIGSIGYAVMALGMGMLIGMFGYITIPVCSITLAALVLAIAFSIKEEKFESVVVKTDRKNSGGIKDLMKIGPFMFGVVVVFFTGLSINPINNLKTVFIQNVGGDVGMLGMDSFIGVCVQALFIFISGNLKRIPANVRLFLMSGCVLITMVLITTAINPWMVIAGTVFSNMSYGIMLPTQREIVETCVPDQMKTTAHSLSDTMYSGFSGIIALTYSGYIIDALGARYVSMLGIGIMLIPCVLTMFRLFFRKKSV